MKIMKLRGIALLLSTASVYGGPTYTCPTVGSVETLPQNNFDLEIVTDPNTLCTLVRHLAQGKNKGKKVGRMQVNVTADGRERVPLARSYAAIGSWEVSAGLLSGDVAVTCGSGATVCTVNLPKSERGEEYILESFLRPTLSHEAEAARFLEQATFGSTRGDISSLVSDGLNYTGWVQEQMTLPVSSLREYYRKRTNPKFEFPWFVGAVGSGPCDKFSRWRKYAIASTDMIYTTLASVTAVRGTGYHEKYLTFEQVEGSYVWKVDGQFRTVTNDFPTDMNGTALALDTKYAIRVRFIKGRLVGLSGLCNCVGCPVWISTPGAEESDWFEIANPAVSVSGVDASMSLDIIDLPNFKSNDLPSIETADDYPLFSEWIKSDENALLNTTSLNGMCTNLPDFRNPLPFDGDGIPETSETGTVPSIFARSTDEDTGSEVVFLYDRHLTLYENTVENPLLDGGGSLVMDTYDTPAGVPVKCHNAQRNFYNDEHCKLSYLPTACAPNEDPKKVIILNDANLEGIRTASGRDLYAITGLTLSDVYDLDTGFDSPCADTSLDQRSRWIKDESDTVCENVADLGPGTLKIYQEYVDARDVGDFNENIVDVVRVYKICDADDQGKTYLGKVRASDGTCWHHVHSSEMNVFDLTGADNITITGNMANVASMDIFSTSIEPNFAVVAKFGDHVEIDDSLPFPLSDQDIQDAFKTLEYNPQGLPVLMCGSPEEIANDPFYGDYGFGVVVPDNSGTSSLSRWEQAGQRHTVWTEMALNAKDQLRMKMAWSLSQIVSVGLPPGARGASDFPDTEGRLAFYDLFVKHGFGNYRNLMRGYSFSVIMAKWLSYEDNSSLQSSINAGMESYPDENYAREIMQLFTVGLYQLHMDGSIIYKDNGNPQDTYSIETIVSYARAWTGFEVSNPDRGGAASSESGFRETSFDPMTININKRDWFPKNDLAGGFIGDKVARCVDLPSKHFVRKGATYQLLGARGHPELHDDPERWTKNPDFLALEIESSSPLYIALCQADSNGNCTLPAKVALETNLDYDDLAKMGAEYAVDTIRTLKMKVGSTSIWYEYVKQPCVEHAFYRDAKRVIKGEVMNNLIQKSSMCANPLLEAATPICSSAGWETLTTYGLIYCNYQGERMTYNSAAAICEENGMEQGYPWHIRTWEPGPCQDGIKEMEFRSWANTGCGLKVKVAFDSSQIAIVHTPGPDRSNTTNVEKLVDTDTLNFFAVPWEGGGASPSLSECLEIQSCEVHGADCLCDTDATESRVYASADSSLSIDQLMSELHIGAADPTSFDVNTYTNLGNCGIADVTVYSKAGGACGSLSFDTIFSFELKSRQMFLKNSESIVSIPGSSFAFRNPVHFISLSDPEVGDAYDETEEVLNSLFYYPSHPPFMAIRVIQRFGISNPSPGFVERASTAYKTGTFLQQFGSGKYGDLGAMVAAILLDEESRAVVLDTDQSHGHLREPLIKVLSFFKSMGLQYDMPKSIPTLVDMQEKIGQGSFENPSVFSFFLPEFAPPGVIQGAGLVAPEGMVLQGDNILSLLDSSFSLVKFGITAHTCHGWGGRMSSFDGWNHRSPFDCPSTEGDTSFAPAKISYLPQSTVSVDDIIDDLDVLLTSGRLKDSNNRAMIKNIIEPMMGDVPKAIRAAQQLVVSTPEYHSTNLPRKLDSARTSNVYTEKHKAPYKAVVIVMLAGGADSFNMLVPTGQCTTGDAYEEYVAARGATHAIPKSNLLSISTTDQHCSEFGVNSNLPIIADLYNQSQAIFFANTGVVAKPMTKHDDWEGESRFRPFAHNTMTETFYSGDPNEVNPGTGVMGRILDLLKYAGHQPSANSVETGTIMLSGDAIFSNPVYTVSNRDPKVLNEHPTIENLIDVIQDLNGVGEVGNSHMSEYWSSRVASAIFEHKMMCDVASIPDMEVTNYDVTESINQSFKAVAMFMKSHKYRKVNRDVFVLTQSGYDMHGADTLSGQFHILNQALDGFIQEIKEQGLWENTVIVQGSDFGRSMNPNANGGTDHAWGGNYFMIGGSVNGGKILGNYPTPLSSESDYWLTRGRLIPTTPWESVWNGIALWLGVHHDEDLAWALPNRDSFGTCSLFTDKDLFVDGACQCVQENGVESTVCDDITYSPTLAPTDLPTQSPTTASPTAELPSDGILVNTLFTPGSTVTAFGCAPGAPGNAFDATTNQYSCDRTNMTDVVPGIIVTPDHGQLTIPKGLRFYPSLCQSCDPLTYLLEGRTSDQDPWIEIASGELPGVAEGLSRNGPQLDINSSYESGDSNHTFASIDYPSQGAAYLEYKLSFPETRGASSPWLRFAEVEIPGMFLPPDPSTSPTSAPSSSPTRAPSNAPTTPSPTAELPSDGILVNTIFTPGSTVTAFGCAPGRPERAFNGLTSQYDCDVNNNITDVTDPSFVAPGIIVKPDHGQLTIAKGLRFYTGASCANCDPLTYVLEGRISDQDPWIEIASGELPGVAEGLARNAAGLDINSSYESGDSTHAFTSVEYPSQGAAYLEYRLTYPTNRGGDGTFFRIGEVEIPGMLVPPEPTISPTTSPTVGLPADAVPVNTIFTPGSTVTAFGCSNAIRPWRTFDAYTTQYSCDRREMGGVVSGIIVTPDHGQLTIAKGIRFYPSKCKSCDPLMYALEGRTSDQDPWIEIASGEFPGVRAGLARNEPRLAINSSYESGDSAHTFSLVEYPANAVAYLEYRLSFLETRAAGSSYLRLGEIEIPGLKLT